MDEDTLIGVINDYDDTRLVSLYDFKYMDSFSGHFSREQYFDWRFHTNLTRFVYDPFTGKK